MVGQAHGQIMGKKCIDLMNLGDKEAQLMKVAREVVPVRVHRSAGWKATMRNQRRESSRSDCPSSTCAVIKCAVMFIIIPSSHLLVICCESFSKFSLPHVLSMMFSIPHSSSSSASHFLSIYWNNVNQLWFLEIEKNTDRWNKGEGERRLARPAMIRPSVSNVPEQDAAYCFLVCSCFCVSARNLSALSYALDAGTLLYRESVLLMLQTITEFDVRVCAVAIRVSCMHWSNFAQKAGALLKQDVLVMPPADCQLCAAPKFPAQSSMSEAENTVAAESSEQEGRAMRTSVLITSENPLSTVFCDQEGKAQKLSLLTSGACRQSAVAPERISALSAKSGSSESGSADPVECCVLRKVNIWVWVMGAAFLAWWRSPQSAVPGKR